MTTGVAEGSKRRRGLQFLAGILVIFGFSSIPQSTLSNLNPGVTAVWGHLVEFGLLGWLWYRWREVSGSRGLTSLPAGLGVAAVVAAADEAYQGLVPGRSSEVADGLCDLAGFIAGVLVSVAIIRRRFWRRTGNGFDEGGS